MHFEALEDGPGGVKSSKIAYQGRPARPGQVGLGIVVFDRPNPKSIKIAS